METLASALSALRTAGRTQAVGSAFGDVVLVASFSFAGDAFLLRQCESLTTRFLGAVATCTSSSSLLCTGGFFALFALFGRSGGFSADFDGVCVGFGLDLSPSGFALGVEGGFGDGAGLSSLSGGGTTSFSAPGSASSSSCHFLILSFTLAGLSILMALPKSAPFIALLFAAGFGLASFFWQSEWLLCCGDSEVDRQCAGHWRDQRVLLRGAWVGEMASCFGGAAGKLGCQHLDGSL